MNAVLLLGGLLTGFVDSIAGGGGLIALPIMLWVLGNGADAVGTNKVVGSCAALVALLVYLKHSKIPWKITLRFSLWIAIGSWIGSSLTPFIPPKYFPYILLGTIPLVLWVLLKKSFWMARPPRASASEIGLFISGLLIGGYDGLWGPGGGTFMLLGLVVFGGVPVLPAVGASKFVNWVSASVAWLRFGQGGYIHFQQGFWMATGVVAGAWIGATQNSKHSGKLVRPMLVVVSVLLFLKTLHGLLQL